MAVSSTEKTAKTSFLPKLSKVTLSLYTSKAEGLAEGYSAFKNLEFTQRSGLPGQWLPQTNSDLWATRSEAERNIRKYF